MTMLNPNSTPDAHGPTQMIPGYEVKARMNSEMGRTIAPSIIGYRRASGTGPSAQCRLYRRSWIGMTHRASKIPSCH
jgi:hypothetical protein